MRKGFLLIKVILAFGGFLVKSTNRGVKESHRDGLLIAELLLFFQQLQRSDLFIRPPLQGSKIGWFGFYYQDTPKGLAIAEHWIGLTESQF
uniref:hypothetical protein n=2 Tax=Roseivirga sp. TaxID=1964215 RepID=UPI004056A4C3